MTEPSQFAVTVCYLRDQRDSAFRIDEQARTAGIDYVEILERHSLDPAVLARSGGAASAASISCMRTTTKQI